MNPPARRAQHRGRAPPPARRGSTLAEELASLVGRSHRALRAAAERRLSVRGETVLAWHLLKVLMRCGPATQVELAAATAQDPASISRALEELESERAVRRTRDPSDRRRLVAAISPRGLRRYRSMTPAVMEGIEERLATLPPPARLELRRLLRQLLGDPAPR